MNNKSIQYINKDFNDFKSTLIEYAKAYFPQIYNDFKDASPGTMFIEMSSAIGDVLSFYQDNQFQENFVQYAQEKKNLLTLAYMFGYVPKVTYASSTDLDVYQLVPRNVTTNSPDFNYSLTLSSGGVITSPINGQSFLTSDIVDFSFSSSLNPTDISVYDTNNGDNFQYYLLKKKVKAISGAIKSQDFTFSASEKFASIEIEDDQIIQIIDIIDSDGNNWYEVPYLSQNTIFEEIKNVDSNDPNYNQYQDTTPYLLRLKQVSRRFVTRFRADNLLEIQFGSGMLSSADEEIIPNPNNVGLGLVDGISKLTTAYDPSNFIFTQAYGLSPSNTTLTVRYLSGGGLASNTNSNTITNITTLTKNFNSNITTSDPSYSTIFNSVAVNNPNPALGGRGGDTIDDLRFRTMSSFPTQLRAVTKDDYIIRSLSMPSRYGSLAKVYIEQSIQRNENPSSLDMFVLGYNSNKNLVTTSLATKENLKTYLSQYRTINDLINLRDAFIINIGIKFNIVVSPGFNTKEILTSCIAELKNYFDIDKWQINQPIIISEIYSLLSKVKGVQSVINVDIENKVGGEYSQYGYDIKGATRNGVIYPSLDPSCFEIKFQDVDIQGRSTNY